MRLFRATPTTQRRARAVVASAQTTTARGKDSQPSSTGQRWQDLALHFYATCGECWYPAQGYARSLQKIRFFPATLDERGDPQEVEDGPLVELFDRIQDPGGGRTELTGNYGRLMFLIGEGWLTVTVEDGEEAWEFLSPAELKVLPEDEGYERRRMPGKIERLTIAPEDGEISEGQARVWRLWRRDPTYSGLADSPVRGVLDLYQTLASLTAAVGAEGKSRAAQRGALYVPQELDFSRGDAEEPDDDPAAEPFMQELYEAMLANIRDPESAGAMAPFVIRGPALMQTPTGAVPMKDCMGWFPLGPQERYVEIEAWDKTIGRIANGVDLPVPYVTGDTGDANHWSGWLVDEQNFRLHVAPVAQRWCDDVTAAYLRPAAIRDGISEAERVVIGYDPAGAINHPDETKTAREGYLDGIVSPAFYRDKIGATDDDAPSEDELRELIRIISKGTQDGSEPQAETQPQDGGTGNDTQEGTPEQNGNGQTNGGAPAMASAASLQAARVLTALEMTVNGAREKAGARLITKAQGCADCRRKIASVPKALVAATLGEDVVRDIINGHSIEADLVAGASDGLALTIARLGVPADIAHELGALAEQHALRTLFEPDPSPLPPGVHAVVARFVR